MSEKIGGESARTACDDEAAEAPEPIPISALQHWCYCPRQCALIHLQQAFAENIHTLRGRAEHATVDDPGGAFRAGLRVERALPVFHDRLGLVGKCDVVEFAPDGTPYPVEYKHGSRHKAAEISSCDDLQLGAQAICLEYMLNREVLAGAVFYAASKRRREVRIDDALRERVERATLEVRRMLEARLLAFPTSDVRRCRECSLRDDCQPESARPGTLDSALSRLFIPDQ